MEEKQLDAQSAPSLFEGTQSGCRQTDQKTLTGESAILNLIALKNTLPFRFLSTLMLGATV